jgi:hypothetical protein
MFGLFTSSAATLSIGNGSTVIIEGSAASMYGAYVQGGSLVNIDGAQILATNNLGTGTVRTLQTAGGSTIKVTTGFLAASLLVAPKNAAIASGNNISISENVLCSLNGAMADFCP